MKTVREIAVQLENKAGALSAISELLGANGISILGLTVLTDAKSGTLHFIAPDPTRVAQILESTGYSPAIQDVLAAETPHHPGGLNALLKLLKAADVNIEYLYCCLGCQSERNILLLGVDDIAAAHDALAKDWIRLYDEELYMF